MNAELAFGVIRVFGGPELAGTPAQHMCSLCERAHGLCCRSSKLGFWFVAPPVCAGGAVAEKWKPSLAEVLSLGLWMGLGAGLGRVGGLWASSSKEKRHGNETVAQG